MDRNIIITGGARGIGRKTAEAFLKAGESVLLISRTREELEKAKNELSSVSPKVEIYQLDVSDDVKVKELAKFIEKNWDGMVDVLVNAAAILGPIGALDHLNDEEMKHWRKAFEVNIYGTALMSRMVIPFLKRRGGGRIINFSGGGEGGWGNFTAYTASKGAVLRFTESLAKELLPHKIYVNAIAPGVVKTKMVEALLDAGPEKIGQQDYAKLSRSVEEDTASPNKAANLILFLCSPETDGISGKFFSAVWDDFSYIASHKDDIMRSDVYTTRRIKPQL
ncbi:MAG: SDR family oxidoreductase [Parcubacteria group bacterium]|nr:SDR family oxidoreductase [Parcubacteria group bacterium]